MIINIEYLNIHPVLNPFNMHLRIPDCSTKNKSVIVLIWKMKKVQGKENSINKAKPWYEKV